MADSASLPAHVRFPEQAAGAECPACGSKATNLVYEVADIPIHSCTLLDSQAEALEFPTARMRLVSCTACGFLFNAAFRAADLDYTSDYEETQGYSRTFTEWLEEVVRDLVEGEGIRDKHVVEVGCGRGDFLALVCERGANQGLGIDPSQTAGRVDQTAGRGLTLRQEFFSPAHVELPADLIACRHTLEHIADPRTFLELIQQSARKHDALVFIEVPDVLRALEEGAFWDIYYEHCSYFSCGSLQRLFERVGLDATRVELSYADQYIHAFGRARTPQPSPTDDLERLSAAVDDFRSQCRTALAHWHQVIQDAREQGQRVALWGAGSKGTGFLTTLGLGSDSNVDVVVDINPDKQGRFMAGTGQPIIGPEQLAQYGPGLVIAMNPIYLKEIAADLERHGVRAQLVAV